MRTLRTVCEHREQYANTANSMRTLRTQREHHEQYYANTANSISIRIPGEGGGVCVEMYQCISQRRLTAWTRAWGGTSPRSSRIYPPIGICLPCRRGACPIADNTILHSTHYRTRRAPRSISGIYMRPRISRASNVGCQSIGS